MILYRTFNGLCNMIIYNNFLYCDDVMIQKIEIVGAEAEIGISRLARI